MPVDPNIILGIQQPKFDNMVDLQAKGMQMQQMGIQNQMQQRAMADDQATRQAYANAMTAGPDGTPTLDQQKLLTSLPPMLAYKAKQDLAATAATNAKSQMEVSKSEREQHASELGQVLALPPDQQPAAYAALRQKNIAAGLPGAANSPEQFPGAQYLYAGMTALMGPKDQMELKEKTSEFASREADRKLARDQMKNNRDSQALQQTTQELISGRGDAAYQQAGKDYYAAKKADTLVNMYGDPNKLSTPQVNMLVSEVGKIATGGVPSMHELDGLSPGTLQGALASAWSKLSNNPTPANAGAFVKQYQDYAHGISNDAKELMLGRDKRILDSQRSRLGEDNYNNMVNIHLKRFDDAPKAAASGQAPILKTHEIEWAK